MTKRYPFATLLLSTACALALVAGAALAQEPAYQIGSEKAVPVHLAGGQEFEIPLQSLIAYGINEGTRPAATVWLNGAGAIGGKRTKWRNSLFSLPCWRWAFPA